MRISLIKNKVNIIVIIQTIALSLLLNLKLINYSLTKLTNKEEGGYFSLLFVIIYGIFFGSVIIKKMKTGTIGKIRVSKTFIFFVFIMLFWYIISYRYTETNIVQFFCYSLLPVWLCFSGDFDADYLLKSSMIFGIIALPIATSFLIPYTVINMDICYSLLPCIVAVVIDFFSRKKTDKKISLLLYVIPIYYLAILLSRGMRGTVMCVFVAVVLSIFLGPNRKKYTLIRLFTLVFLFICLFFVEDIINFAYEFFLSKGINLYFLNKTISISDDITNGRLDLWKMAIDGFCDSPIIGKGINTFNYWTNRLYPHNFLLQFLFEGGLVAVTWFVIFFIEGTRKVFKYQIPQEIEIYLFAFCVSVPYLLVSANVWTTPLLWVFIGILLKNMCVVNKNDHKTIKQINDGGMKND